MIWTILGACGVVAIYFLLPKSRNEKELARQRQMLRDAEELYAGLVEQIHALPALKARHAAQWPAGIDIDRTRANVLAAGKELEGYKRALAKVFFPLDKETAVGLDAFSLSCVRAQQEIADKIAFLVLADAMVEVGGNIDGFGLKASPQ